MKKLIFIALIVFGAWNWYSQKTHTAVDFTDLDISSPQVATDFEFKTSTIASNFRCDGRTHCSQMNSCAEATYFLQHCPNVKMDGNGDGVPCERQWCH